MAKPNLDRVIWFLEQMNADHSPISDEQTLRFGRNPDTCLTTKCLMSRRIIPRVQDLKLGPDNQPVYTTVEEYFIGETKFEFGELFREAVGEEPPPALRSSVLGFLGQKILFFFEGVEKCWVVLGDRVVGEFLTDYDDLKVSIDQNHERAIFWSSKDLKIFTLEKNGRNIIQVESTFASPYPSILTVLRYQERLYVVCKEQAQIIELTTEYPIRFKSPHSQAIAACVVYFGIFILVREADGLKVYNLTNEHDPKGTIQKDGRSEKIRLGHDFLENFSMQDHSSFRYLGQMRNGQIAWCDSYRREPAMNMVTEIFSVEGNHRYWGIVDNHLFLMETEL